MKELADALAWGLGIALVLLCVLTVIGWFENRCRICHGSGFFEATETFAEYEVVSEVPCPAHCAPKKAWL